MLTFRIHFQAFHHGFHFGVISRRGKAEIVALPCGQTLWLNIEQGQRDTLHQFIRHIRHRRKRPLRVEIGREQLRKTRQRLAVKHFKLIDTYAAVMCHPFENAGSHKCNIGRAVQYFQHRLVVRHIGKLDAGDLTDHDALFIKRPAFHQIAAQRMLIRRSNHLAAHICQRVDVSPVGTRQDHPAKSAHRISINQRHQGRDG